MHCYEHTFPASADVEFDDVGGDVWKVIEVEPAMEQIMLQLVFLRVECFWKKNATHVNLIRLFWLGNSQHHTRYQSDRFHSVYLDFTLPYAIVFNIEECHILVNLNNGDILIEGRNTPHTKEKVQDNDDLKSAIHKYRTITLNSDLWDCSHGISFTILFRMKFRWNLLIKKINRDRKRTKSIVVSYQSQISISRNQ